MSVERYVVIPDLQIPYNNKRQTDALIRFVAATQPDRLLCIGDELDSPEPSRWNRGMAGEFEPTLQKGIDDTHQVMAAFREALGDKPFIISRSNHTDRVETYVRKYAPALATMRALKIEQMLGYDKLDITYARRPVKVAPGWLMMHGDEGSMSRTAGGTAMGLARKTGFSVVCGHTHRAAVISESRGVNGKTTTLTGFEVGNLMTMSQAGYLKTGGADWQSAFGILYVDGDRVVPHVVPVRQDGSFVAEGRVWK